MTRRQLRESDPSGLRPCKRLPDWILPIRPLDVFMHSFPCEMSARLGGISLPLEMRDETPPAGRVFNGVLGSSRFTVPVESPQYTLALDLIADLGNILQRQRCWVDCSQRTDLCCEFISKLAFIL